MPAIKVTQGAQKNSFLIEGPDGHCYYRNKIMKGGRISLECAFRKKKNVWCRGRASIDSEGDSFKCTHRHTYHNKDYYLTQKFRFAVLSRCRKGDFTSFRQIYNEERRRMSPDISRKVCGNIPFVSLRPSMARARKSSLPLLPKTLPDLADMLSSDRYAHLSQTLDGEDNIFAASGGSRADGTAFVVLASKRMLDELAKARKVFSDGTFCTPSKLECRQVWNIVKLRNHHIIPMVRVLMQSKSEATYTLVLQKLKELRPSFRPVEVMCDFEEAQENAWKLLFPNARVSGCLFHSSKKISEKAKKLKLKRLIQTNHSANSITRSMCGLAFLPSDKIPNGFRKLERRAVRENVHDKLEPHFRYFKNYWIARKEILSVYNCPDRTNNACESDNRTLRALIKFKHPSVFCFLRGALESEDNAVQDIVVLNIPRKASRKRRSSVIANDAKVKALVTDLREGHMKCTDFLRKVSRTTQLAFNRGLGFDDDFG